MKIKSVVRQKLSGTPVSILRQQRLMSEDQRWSDGGRPVLVPSGHDASVVKIDGVFGQTMRSDDATYLKVRRGRRIVSVAVIIASASTPMVYAKCPAWKAVPLMKLFSTTDHFRR